MTRQTIVATQRFKALPVTPKSLVKRWRSWALAVLHVRLHHDVMQRATAKEDRDGTPRDYRVDACGRSRASRDRH